MRGLRPSWELGERQCCASFLRCASARLRALRYYHEIRILYFATVFLSSLLLFLVQPMLAKAILPWFGGSAGVWTACMLFFQAVLLLGYAYSHWVTRRFAPGAQTAIHLTLVVASLAFLPLVPAAAWKPVNGAWLEGRILALLAVTVGLPYFLLSTTSPLVQVWYAGVGAGTIPYRLFAVSNAASLAALLSYPFVVEPWLGTSAQLRTWSAGYAVFAVVVAAAAFAGRRREVLLTTMARSTGGERLLWLGLAAAPSVLWLAVANQLSQSVAALPLLWVAPLSLYLLSLTLCFQHDAWYRPGWFRWLLPVSIAALTAASKQHAWSDSILWGMLLYAGGLFGCCMFCHGELARRRPHTGDLTTFYLMVASGGALGGAFVSLVAPVIFNDYLELTAGTLGCLLLALPLLYGYSLRQQVRRLALIAAAFAAAVQFQSQSKARARNFYGTLEVRERGEGVDAVRAMYNGTILHGLQFLAPEKRRIPATYYGERSGVSLELSRIRHERRRIGVVGLGIGTLAAFARPGDVIRFYEIDPLVVQFAHQQFDFLKDCQGTVEIAVGDARMVLESEGPQGFDLLAVDAFAGDSIPVHLLTRQAFELYLQHLKPDGSLAVHVSSKYLDLAPIVLRNASALGREALVVQNSVDPARQITAATWVIVGGARKSGEVKGRPWTDDYSNLFGVFK